VVERSRTISAKTRTQLAERVAIGIPNKECGIHTLSLARCCLFLLVSTLLTYAQASDRRSSGDEQAYRQRLEKSLASIQTIKLGMTRGDLLTLFKLDGGLQFTRMERYVHKQCPSIKVDVTFTPVGDTDDRWHDRIESLSKPYLESPFSD